MAQNYEIFVVVQMDSYEFHCKWVTVNAGGVIGM